MKNDIVLIGSSNLCSTVIERLALTTNHKVEVINDIPTTEPFILTNPYANLNMDFTSITKAKTKVKNNRKKVKRKKAKNGKH